MSSGSGLGYCGGFGVSYQGGRMKHGDRRQFKRGIDTEDCRRRREDTAVEIRKLNRESLLMKRQSVDTSTFGEVILQGMGW